MSKLLKMPRLKKRPLEPQNQGLGDDSGIKLFGHIINFSSSDNKKSSNSSRFDASRLMISNLGEIENVNSGLLSIPSGTDDFKKDSIFEMKNKKIKNKAYVEPKSEGGGEGEGEGDGEGEVENFVSSCGLDAIVAVALPTEMNSATAEEFGSCTGSNSGSEDNLNNDNVNLMKREKGASMNTVTGEEKGRNHNSNYSKSESESPPQILNEPLLQVRSKLMKTASLEQGSSFSMASSSPMNRTDIDLKHIEPRVRISLFSNPLFTEEERVMKMNSMQVYDRDGNNYYPADVDKNKARRQRQVMNAVKHEEEYSVMQEEQEEEGEGEEEEEETEGKNHKLDRNDLFRSEKMQKNTNLNLNFREKKEDEDEDEEERNGMNIKLQKDENLNKSFDYSLLKKPDHPVPCPRCESMDTKFCYYNNYNIRQPRHFCKQCQRYWTAGGSLRNVPVGSGRRKNKHAVSKSNCDLDSSVTPSNSNQNQSQGLSQGLSQGQGQTRPRLVYREDEFIQPWFGGEENRGYNEPRSEVGEKSLTAFGRNSSGSGMGDPCTSHVAGCDKSSCHNSCHADDDADPSVSKYGSLNTDKSASGNFPVYSPMPFLGSNLGDVADKNAVAPYFPSFGPFNTFGTVPEEYKNMIPSSLPPNLHPYPSAPPSSDPSDTPSGEELPMWCQMASGMMATSAIPSSAMGPWGALSPPGMPTMWTNGITPFGYFDGSWVYPYNLDGTTNPTGARTTLTDTTGNPQVKPVVPHPWNSTAWNPAMMSPWARWAGAWQMIPPWMSPSPSLAADVATVSNSSAGMHGKYPSEDSDRVQNSSQIWMPKTTRLSDLNGECDSVWRKINCGQQQSQRMVDSSNNDLEEKSTGSGNSSSRKCLSLSLSHGE